MPDITPLDELTSVCGQLRPVDMEEVARLGFGAVVNNRPDGEQWLGQPKHAELAKAAGAHGLSAYFVPFTMQTLDAYAVHALVEAMSRDQKPLLVFCASGFRSALLWAIARAATTDRPVDEIIAWVDRFPLSTHRRTIERLSREVRQSLDRSRHA